MAAARRRRTAQYPDAFDQQELDRINARDMAAMLARDRNLSNLMGTHPEEMGRLRDALTAPGNMLEPGSDFELTSVDLDDYPDPTTLLGSGIPQNSPWGRAAIAQREADRQAEHRAIDEAYGATDPLFRELVPTLNEGPNNLAEMYDRIEFDPDATPTEEEMGGPIGIGRWAMDDEEVYQREPRDTRQVVTLEEAMQEDMRVAYPDPTGVRIQTDPRGLICMAPTRMPVELNLLAFMRHANRGVTRVHPFHANALYFMCSVDTHDGRGLTLALFYAPQSASLCETVRQGMRATEMARTTPTRPAWDRLLEPSPLDDKK